MDQTIIENFSKHVGELPSTPIVCSKQKIDRLFRFLTSEFYEIYQDILGLTEVEASQEMEAIVQQQMRTVKHAHGQYSDAEFKIIETADFVGDVVYYLKDWCAQNGYPLDTIIEEIHKSNMTKVKGGALVQNGKVCKGANYIPPNLSFVLNHDKRELRSDTI